MKSDGVIEEASLKSALMKISLKLGEMQKIKATNKYDLIRKQELENELQKALNIPEISKHLDMEGDIYYPTLKFYWSSQPVIVSLDEYRQNLEQLGLNEEEYN